jgi:hypothetical protein
MRTTPTARTTKEPHRSAPGTTRSRAWMHEPLTRVPGLTPAQNQFLTTTTWVNADVPTMTGQRSMAITTHQDHRASRSSRHITRLTISWRPLANSCGARGRRPADAICLSIHLLSDLSRQIDTPLTTWRLGGITPYNVCLSRFTWQPRRLPVCASPPLCPPGRSRYISLHLSAAATIEDIARCNQARGDRNVKCLEGLDSQGQQRNVTGGYARRLPHGEMQHGLFSAWPLRFPPHGSRLKKPKPAPE